MRIAESTVTALQKVVTGDKLRGAEQGIAPYRSGPDLISFFSQFGAEDVYDNSFPSRWIYAENAISGFNGTPAMVSVIEAAVDPRHFLGGKFGVEPAVKYLNSFLEFDGWKLILLGRRYRLTPFKDAELAIGDVFSGDSINQRFISESLEKCDRKLQTGDLTGAITNARSLVEAVLRELEAKLYPEPPGYDGNLSALYIRVYRRMNLDPSAEGLSGPAREILSGLISAVSGLAPLRNTASDAHALEYEPRQHHATLAVNCAKSVVRFLADSYSDQMERGKLKME